MQDYFTHTWPHLLRLSVSTRYNGSVKSDYQCSNTDKSKTGKSGDKDKKGKDNKDEKGSWVCKDGYWFVNF